MNPDPLPVEMLASEDARRLQTALDAPRPITVAEHHRFREGIGTKASVDPIDELVADIRSVRKEDEP